MKTMFGVLIVATVAVLAAAHYWRDDFADRPTFRTLPVTRGDLFIGVTATGTVEPTQIIDVGARIVGSIKSFGADSQSENQSTIDYCSHVKQGDVLAQLDDLPLRAELDRARVNRQLAEAELNIGRARLKQAERAFLRAKQLRGTNSEADYERAEAEYDIAQAEVAMSEAKLDQAEIARKQAEINLTYTVITSPVDGVVIDRRVNVGQTVVAGMNAPSLFLIARDLDRMVVWAAVNEADIGAIHIGQAVTFTVDAYPHRSFSGNVSQIRLNASLQQNVVTYGVIVDVNNEDGKLLPYMTAKLQFDVASRQNAVLVPNQALRWKPTWTQISPAFRGDLPAPQSPGAIRSESPEGAAGEEAEVKVDLEAPTLWIIADDGLVRPVPVEVGLTDGLMTELLGGDTETNAAVVTGVVPKPRRDFVSSFVAKVTDIKK